MTAPTTESRTTYKAYITPAGRAVGPAVLVNAWRTVRENPGMLVKGWDHFPTDGATVLRGLREGLHDRINRCTPTYGAGRKWDSDWQRNAAHTARAVNTPRLVVDWVPLEFRGRLSHRLRTTD